MRKWNTVNIFLFYDGTPEILNSKITFLFTANTLTPQFPAKYVLLSVVLGSSSLWPRGTIEKGLRLRSRHPRVTEKASDRPAHTSGHHLWPGALTPLEDEQRSDEEPEEEVDPRCRLVGRRQRGDVGINMNSLSLHWWKSETRLGFTQDWNLEKGPLTSALCRLL